MILSKFEKKALFLTTLVCFLFSIEAQQSAQQVYDQGYKDGYAEGFKQGYRRSNEQIEKNRATNNEQDTGIIDQILEADASKMIMDVLEPFRAIPEEDLKRVIYEKAGKNDFGKWLRDKEWFLEWCVNMIKDPIALSELAGLLKERRQIWRFILANILIIILNLTAKRYIRLRLLPKKYTYWRLFFVGAINILVFWVFFGHNLLPTIIVTFRTLF